MTNKLYPGFEGRVRRAARTQMERQVLDAFYFSPRTTLQVLCRILYRRPLFRNVWFVLRHRRTAT